MKSKIRTHVQHHEKDKHVQLLIYYKHRKVKKLFIKNKTTNNETTNVSENYNVIYKFYINVCAFVLYLSFTADVQRVLYETFIN